jgi:hypothetical protein
VQEFWYICSPLFKILKITEIQEEVSWTQNVFHSFYTICLKHFHSYDTDIPECDAALLGEWFPTFHKQGNLSPCDKALHLSRPNLKQHNCQNLESHFIPTSPYQFP